MPGLPPGLGALLPARARSACRRACTDCIVPSVPREQVRSGLGHLDPYFTKLADGMVAWIDSWKKLNP